MDMDKDKIALDLLPPRWRDPVQQKIRETEEIRLRIDRKPSLLIGRKEYPIFAETVTEEDLLRILEKATGASFHSAQAALSDGYLNAKGVRIGVCGKAAIHSGERCVFQKLSSLSIRIPRECKGICKKEIDEMLLEPYRNTLVIGKPGAGKTTVLREMIRRFANMGYRIAVADERNELAAADEDGQAYDLGTTSDVLIGLPKTRAAMMLLRGMNPEIIAMDEITQEEDVQAITKISGCGVRILASAHGESKSELMQRKAYRDLLERGIFSRILSVQHTKAGRQYILETLLP